MGETYIAHLDGVCGRRRGRGRSFIPQSWSRRRFYYRRDCRGRASIRLGQDGVCPQQYHDEKHYRGREL